MIITLKRILLKKTSCKLEISYYFILIGGLVKSLNQVDLTVLCKSLNRVHTSLYAYKSFHKVDLIVLIAPNKVDHQM